MISENALVPTAIDPHGDALAGDNGLVIMGPGSDRPWPNGSAQPEILHSGLDPVWILHSLRRRWMLATGLGLVAAIVLALTVWLITPSQSTAVMLLKVASRNPVLLSHIDEGTDSDFLTFKRTQTELFKSHFVLQAALDRPGILNLPSVQAEPDKVQWLGSNLDITFPGSAEVLRVAMSGENPDEIKQFVEAATEAYMAEVVYKKRDTRLNTRDSLIRAQSKLTDEIRRKTQSYNQLARQPQEALVDRTINVDELSMLRRQRLELEKEINDEVVKASLLKAQRDDPLVISARVDQLIATDPQVIALREQIGALELAIVEEQGRARRQDAPSVARLAERRNSLAQSLAQREATLRPQLAFTLANSPEADQESQLSASRIRKTLLEESLAQTGQEIERLTGEIKQQDEHSIELDATKAELDQLRSVASNMGNKIEAWEIEVNSPARVAKLQNEATLTPGIDTLQRYILVTLGGLIGFSLTALGIALWDFRSRRLNTPGQIDEGLGLQVLGELPPLTRPHDTGPAVAEVALLTESIDGVRTRLIYLGQSQSVHSVMVTSASGQEGSTTVASQLAASLARAGKRTLLVDGDLRHPELHRYFDLPQSDGLAEVLEGSVTAKNVIRTTESPYLSVLTAGQYDAAALQALAQDRLKPILQELAKEFEFIIIDAAPVLNLTDALLIGRQTDGAILAARRDVSTVPDIHTARTRLRNVGIRVLGAVVNGVKRPMHERASRMRLVLSTQDTPAKEVAVH